MRYLHNAQRTSGHNYHIVHDAITISDDYAIICGSTNEDTDCDVPRDSFQARAFIAKIDLNDGSFVWHKSVYRGRLGIRLAINNGDGGSQMICMATHGELVYSYPGLSFFDMSGNLISDKMCEAAGALDPVYYNHNVIPEYPSSINIHHTHIIQNIYFMANDEDVFVSGKFVDLNVTYSGNDYGPYDMPYSMVFDYGNLSFGNVSLYKTSQTFTYMISTFLSYDLWIINDCPNHEYPQFYTASNTLPCLSECGTDEFVTVTLDKAGEYENLTNMSEDKVWIFSNDQYVCGANIGDMTTFEVYDQNHINIENDDIFVTPDVDDLSFYNTDPNWYLFDCIQYTP